MKKYPITPVAKPRMTRRDKWLNPPRPAVAKYWLFKELVGMYQVRLPLRDAHIIFVLPMAKSWSKKKQAAMCDTPHEQIPDWDNLGKALSDAIYNDDSKISDIRISKKWGYEGEIIIK